MADKENEIVAPAEAVAPTTDAPPAGAAAAKPDETPSVTEEAAPEGPSETHWYVAIRNFVARYEHQLLTFVEDEIIDSRVGHKLRGLGAPIKLVEKSAKELKGKL
jgi:hypothetical protein